MEFLNDRSTQDSESKAVLKCFFCDENIYENDYYYVLNGFNCCEECLNIHFKFKAEE